MGHQLPGGEALRHEPADAGGINQEAPELPGQVDQARLGRGVGSPVEFGRKLRGPQIQARHQGVEEARLPDPRLADQGRSLARHQGAQLVDPDTGAVVEDDTPQSIVRKILRDHAGRQLAIAFQVRRPEKLTWDEILAQLKAQGFTRLIVEAGKPSTHRFIRLDDAAGQLADSRADAIHVVQDRLEASPTERERLTDAVTSALHFGQEELLLFAGRGCG
jgi:hypothetical protein